MLDKKILICFSTILGNISTENENKANINSYADFFSSLYQSDIPVSIHLTGSFLQMLQSKDQAFYDIIKELLEKKQIELIGGAYFSPLFPIISPVDLVGQIDMYVTALRKLFSIRTKSAYLPYSAWNASVIAPMKKTGTVEYCLLDNRLFLRHGLSPSLALSLEDAGKVLTGVPYEQCFEINKSPEEFYQSIITQKNLNDDFNLLPIFLPYSELSALLKKDENDDSWMDTFKRLIAKDKVLSLSSISAGLKEQKFFPNEFIEANVILNNEAKNVSVKKILCQNHFAYEMYKKIMYVSVLTNQIRGDKQRKISATQQMWKSQNAFFFMEVAKEPEKNRNLIFDFYKNLLLAEKTARDQQFSDIFAQYDFNLDGLDEYISQTKNINAYVCLFGAKIFEYDFLLAHKNYCAVPVPETGMFLDYFLDENDLNVIHEKEPKHSLKNEQYQQVKYSAQKSFLALRVKTNYKGMPISLKKNYSFNGDFISVQFIIKNESEKRLSTIFASSLNIAVGKLGNTVPSMTAYAQNEKRESSIEYAKFFDLGWIQIDDAEGKTRLSFTPNEKLKLIVLPVKHEDTVIAVRLYFYWDVDLDAYGESEKLITMQAEKIRVRKNK